MFRQQICYDATTFDTVGIWDIEFKVLFFD